MILDSEEQRKHLLALIEVAPVQGPVGQVRETLKAMDQLKAKIMDAPIAQKPDPVADPGAPSKDNPGKP
jgi:hypothetical protein